MKQRANQFKYLQRLHSAMLAGMVLFCLVSAVTRFSAKLTVDTSLDKVLQVMVLLVSFGSIRAGFFIFNKKLQSIPPMAAASEKLSVYRTAAIIKWAMIEGPVLLAVISFMITRNYAFIALAFALIILFALQGPLKQKIMLQLQLTDKDVAMLEGVSE